MLYPAELWAQAIAFGRADIAVQRRRVKHNLKASPGRVAGESGVPFWQSHEGRAVADEDGSATIAGLRGERDTSVRGLNTWSSRACERDDRNTRQFQQNDRLARMLLNARRTPGRAARLEIGVSLLILWPIC